GHYLGRSLCSISARLSFVLTVRPRSPKSVRNAVTKHQLCDTSQIFVGLSYDQVVSTVTLVADGERGLPMETMFDQELATFRAEGRRVAEVSCLADRRAEPRRFLEAFSQLTRMM